MHKLTTRSPITQVTRALPEAEDGFRQMFKSSHDAMIVLIPPLWEFGDTNQAAAQLFGAASSADFATFKLADISPKCQPDGRSSAEKLQDIIQTVLADGFLFFEWEYRRVNGETFPADVLLTRIEVRGAWWIQATIRDISARNTSKALQNAIFNSANFSSIATDAKGK